MTEEQVEKIIDLQLTDKNRAYLDKAADFMESAAKMDNIPLVYMVAAAFRLEDEARELKKEISRIINAFQHYYIEGTDNSNCQQCFFHRDHLIHL